MIFFSKLTKPFKTLVNRPIIQNIGIFDNNNANIRKVNHYIRYLLLSLNPNEIKPIKNSLIKLMYILHKDKDENSKKIIINKKK